MSAAGLDNSLNMRPIDNYKDDSESDSESFYEIESDILSSSSVSNNPLSHVPTLWVSYTGSKPNVKILQLSDYRNNHRVLRKIQNYFPPNVEVEGYKGRPPVRRSYERIPALSESDMGKSCLKTQLVFAFSIKVLGKGTGTIVLWTAAGAVTGALIGGGIGALVAGIPTAGIGVVPGLLIGGGIGAGVGGGAGFLFGGYKAISNGIKDTKAIYKDFKILQDVEKASHKSIAATIRVAHEFFISYLKDIDLNETEPNIYCTISGDIMILPVRTNCDHVFELLNLSYHLERLEDCPLCRTKVTEAVFDFDRIKKIQDSVDGALKYLKKSAGNQRMLLVKKHCKATNFEHMDKITSKKIKEGKPLSIAEIRTLYFIVKKYSKNTQRIKEFVFDSVLTLITKNEMKGTISKDECNEMVEQLKQYYKQN